MLVLRDKRAMQEHAGEQRRAGRRLGLVPTMGALHAGHLSLLGLARPGCDQVVASIFVNPLQFGPGEDLERYPRDLQGDVRQLEAAGCDLVFAPEAADMYAPGASTRVEVHGLDAVLCGRSRPGHFVGVATVVAKLLHIVQPHVAVFGQKDAQQAILLRRMVRDLDWPVTLRFGPIWRDPDGLALSSRNVYLSAAERREALLLHEALQRARALVESGERRAETVRTAARQVLERGAHVRVDYFEAVEIETLQPLPLLAGRVLLAVAASVGKTRLIDNLLLEVRGDQVAEAELEA